MMELYILSDFENKVLRIVHLHIRSSLLDLKREASKSYIKML